MVKEEIVKQKLYEKYIEPTKKKREHFIGVELEMPIVNLNKAAVDFALVHRITREFMEEFHFEEQGIDDEGNIYAAVNNENGDILSYDCSYNNLEFSFGKTNNLNDIFFRFNSYYLYMNKKFNEEHHTLTGMGVNPYRIFNRMEPIPNGRYRMLLHHINSYKNYDLPMYFHNYPTYGLFSSASQVQLDVDYDKLIDTLNVFSKLEPIKAILFSNSVILEEQEHIAGIRDMLWENSTHGINPHNVGMFGHDLASIDDLMKYIESTSMYCVEKEGKYINFPPVNVLEYFRQEKIKGEFFNGTKYESIWFVPEIEDLKYLRTFKFEDLTFRGTIEFRSVCCQPISDVMSVAAFHVGLMEKIEELKDILEKDYFLFHQGYNASELRKIFNMMKWPENFKQDQVYQLVKQVVDLAKEGLEQRDLGEVKYLEPLYGRINKKTNPAKYMLQKLKAGAKIEELIKEYSI